MDHNLAFKGTYIVSTGYLLALLCSKSVWGHSVHLGFFRFVKSKTAGGEPNGTKCGRRRYLRVVHIGYFTVKCTRSVWGRPVHFRFLRFSAILYLKKKKKKKKTVRREKRPNIFVSFFDLVRVGNLLTVKCPMSFWGPLVHFGFLTSL